MSSFELETILCQNNMIPVLFSCSDCSQDNSFVGVIVSLGPCIDLFDSKKFTHFLYILKGIHKYFGGAKPVVSCTRYV